MKKSKELVLLRKNIVDTMKGIEDEWVTSDGIRSKMIHNGLGSKSISLEKIGNNLRVLKDAGIVSDTKIDGKRCWSLTGNKFDARPVHKMIVAFPQGVYDGMCEGALSTGLSKTGFVVDSVQKRISDQ